MLALHDFAAGLSLLPGEIDKERGVVLEEWRGRLGAGSRLTDKQLPVSDAGLALRRPAADRLARGDHGRAARTRCWPSTRSGTGPTRWRVIVVGDLPVDEAERLVRQRFGVIPAATGAVLAVNRSVPAHERHARVA